MRWARYLFSFRGRVSRQDYWALVAVTIGSQFAFSIVAQFLFGAMVSPGAAVAFVILYLIWNLAFLVASFAVSVKRLHDRNKSGWWILLLGMLPALLYVYVDSLGPAPTGIQTLGAVLVISLLLIWNFVELGCLRGTEGDNRFGTDPLGGITADVIETFN